MCGSVALMHELGFYVKEDFSLVYFFFLLKILRLFIPVLNLLYFIICLILFSLFITTLFVKSLRYCFFKETQGSQSLHNSKTDNFPIFILACLTLAIGSRLRSWQLCFFYFYEAFDLNISSIMNFAH